MDAGVVRFRPILFTALAVVGASAIPADPILKGLAIVLMAGEIAGLLIGRVAVPAPYFMANKEAGPSPRIPAATDESECYTLRVSLTEWGIPAVRVVKPAIAYNPAIHMYRNGTLCLFHPPTQPWSGAYDLHKTIIPWTAEWLVYYELYLTEGKWLGPEVPHGELQLE